MKTHPNSIFIQKHALDELLQGGTVDLWSCTEPIPGYGIETEFVPASAYVELKEQCEKAEFSANGFESLYDSACEEMASLKVNFETAIGIIEQYGGIDGDHHKTWVIDQVVRALTGDGYSDWVEEMKGSTDEHGEREYDWDVGIAP